MKFRKYVLKEIAKRKKLSNLAEIAQYISEKYNLAFRPTFNQITNYENGGKTESTIFYVLTEELES